MKIFFGDLVHTWDKKGIWTFPLNVGYVASYAKKYLSKVGINCDCVIFKDPEKIIGAIKKEKPDVVALSYYEWNTELNRKIHDIAKEHVPNVLAVGGGGRDEGVVIGHQLGGERRDVFRQHVLVGGIVGEMDLAHACDLRRGIGHACAVCASDKQVHFAELGRGGDCSQSCVLHFCVVVFDQNQSFHVLTSNIINRAQALLRRSRAP